MSKVKHVHAEIIKAWADGAEIEGRHPSGLGPWGRLRHPLFRADWYYRIKPEPKPDLVLFAGVSKSSLTQSTTHTRIELTCTENRWGSDNLKLTFDGETGELKAAEVEVLS